MKSHRIAIATLAAAGLLLAGCGGSTTGKGSATGKGANDSNQSASSGGANTSLLATTPATKNLSSLTWWIWYRPIASIDPVKYDDYPEDLIIPNMCESLFRQAPGMKTVPDLAQSWSQPNPDTVIFNLRRGVKFWDGTPMTSADVVYSLKRNLVAANQSIYGFIFRHVKSISATGPYTVTVKMTAPDVTFIPELATMGGAVVEKKFTQAAGATFGTPQGKVMCTGPYKLQSWNGTSSLVMVRNDAYWNKALMPKTRQITFVWPQDPGQVESGFSSGSFAGGFDILAADIPPLESSTAGKLYVEPSTLSMEIEALAVIGTKGPIASPLVRRALSLSIDRPAVIKAIQAGVGVPAYTYAGGGYWSYDTARFATAYHALASSDQDIAKAKQLVREAGSAAKGQMILAVQGSSTAAADEGAIVQQSAAAVGLHVQLRTVSDAQYGALFSDPKARAGIDMGDHQLRPGSRPSGHLRRHRAAGCHVELQ